MLRKKVIVLSGVTASGKSEVAIKIATILNGVIINADSKQVYKNLQIITAQPTHQDYQKCQHKLYSYVDACNTEYSVVNWCIDAQDAINATLYENQIPILVGGSGFYIKKLTSCDVSDAFIDQSLKIQCSQLANDYSTQELEEKFAIILDNITPNDKYRIAKALERKYLVSDINAQIKHCDLRYNQYALIPERQLIYERINSRFINMIYDGVINEIHLMYMQNITLKSSQMKSHGIPEIINYLKGESSLQYAINKSQQNIRNYAKRQITWFKKHVSQDRVFHNADDLIDAVLSDHAMQCSGN